MNAVIVTAAAALCALWGAFLVWVVARIVGAS